jgi:hypothetical protein
VHIAVVTSDMGLPGVTGVPGCSGYGDDGLFQNTPHPSPENPQCGDSYPEFPSYEASNPTGPSASKISQDFGCVANVGAKGCGFEQQLASPLKALWPSSDTRITFLAPAGDPEHLGHGDRENASFLTNNRDHLFDVRRYVQGFKALRPGQENLVVFAAITRVPLDFTVQTQQLWTLQQ